MQINQLESSVHQMNGGRARTIGCLQVHSFYFFGLVCCRASHSPNAQAPVVQAKLLPINQLIRHSPSQTNQSINQSSINQSINQSSIIWSIGWSINQSNNQVINQSIHQLFIQSIIYPIKQPLNLSFTHLHQVTGQLQIALWLKDLNNKQWNWTNPWVRH